MIEFEVDKEDVRRLQWALRKLQKKVPMALKNAINKTAAQVNRKIRAGRSAGYTVKAGKFNAGIKTQRANVGHLDATITASGRPLTLSQSFKTSASKRAGGKADVVKEGLKSLESRVGGKAFLPKSGKAGGLMAQREGRKRFPIKVFHGNSVPVMFEKIWLGERGGQGNMEAFTGAQLAKEINAQIARLTR